MIQVGDMKFIDFEETLDRDLGPVGTSKRDKFERSVDESVHAYKLGEAIKQVRLFRNLTQEQLGEKRGVQKAQISRRERGKSISLSSIYTTTHQKLFQNTKRKEKDKKVA